MSIDKIVVTWAFFENFWHDSILPGITVELQRLNYLQCTCWFENNLFVLSFTENSNVLFTWASMHIFSKRDDYQRFAKRRVLLIAVTSSKETQWNVSEEWIFFDYSSKRVARYTSLFVTLFDVWFVQYRVQFQANIVPQKIVALTTCEAGLDVSTL